MIEEGGKNEDLIDVKDKFLDLQIVKKFDVN